MKNLNNNLNLTSNPSYLGADRLWADRNSELSREDIVIGNEYDGI